jgi:hypothetical protein
MIKFMLITNDPELAQFAETCGVGRVFVDLEQHGKQERQGHLDTFISGHLMADVAKVKAKLSQADLLVRLNPLYSDTQREVDEAIMAGADLLMLPMIREAEEVRCFADLVNSRVGVIPLVETIAAANDIDEIVNIPGVVEVYIGLNDLHLEMQLSFMFELLANGFVDKLAKTINAAGLPFGFGGIARVGEGIIPGELILGEHLRLGSSSVILSRTFHRNDEVGLAPRSTLDLRSELEKLLSAAEGLKQRSLTQEIEDHRYFQSKVEEFLAGKKC